MGFIIAYGRCIDQVDTVKYSAEFNIFYGVRVMRIVMAIWGFLTLVIILIFSPYRWVINSPNTNDGPSVNSETASETGSSTQMLQPVYSHRSV